MTPKDIERFWLKVNKNGPVHPRLGTPCWLWTSGTAGRGYGKMHVGGRNGAPRYAHRIAYELTYGPLPPTDRKNGIVRHSCDNILCCNPAHLILGTQQENIQDCIDRGRRVPGRALGELNGKHTKPENTPRGESHFSRTKPEKLARGERHGAYTKPEPRRRGELNGRAVVSLEQVIEIRDRYANENVTQQKLANLFGISRSQIAAIISGRSWKLQVHSHSGTVDHA